MMSATDEYVMGRTSEEYQRLRSQAQLWNPATRRLFQQAGLHAGMSCLDIGCGPGEVMRILGEIAGRTGQVTGVDMDGKIGREALAALQAGSDTRFAFVEGDVENDVTFPEASFDVTFARITLVHLKDPIAVLRKMHAWTKPGGCVLVQEYDFHSLAVDPEWSGMAEFEKVFHGVFKQAGRDLRLGCRLPTLFVDAGIGSPDGSDIAAQIGPFSQFGPLLQATYSSLVPAALKWGLTSQEESEEFSRQILHAMSETRHTILSPMLIGVWRRKL